MIWDILLPLFFLLVFPGFLFLSAYGTLLEWIDRKCYALMQNRIGPPVYQPVADFIKLCAKEIIIPRYADSATFRLLPFFAVAAVVTAMMFLPVWSQNPLYSFQGDLIVAIYLLTVPTATFFLAGWSSASPYATIGSVRVMTQLFAYEVPLLLSLIGPAIIAGSWNIAEISVFMSRNPVFILVEIPAFLIALVALQGKLERVPFDIPHGETEIVGGAFTEYSGGLLGLFRLGIDMEMVVGAALLNAVFLGGALGTIGVSAILTFLVKTTFIVFLLSVMKALMARIRIEQMINFCWKILAPLSLMQIVLNIAIKAKAG